MTMLCVDSMAVAVGLDCGGESRNRLVANAGVRQNGPSMSLAAVMDGQAPCGGQQADDWAYR
jgi:hypothetical protein